MAPRNKQSARATVPSVPEANGNSETFASPLYKYDFVINNWTVEEKDKLCQTLSQIAKKAVVGSEIGEQGTPHLQCYVSLINKERINGLHKYPGLERAHFGKCRNEDALIQYCLGINPDKTPKKGYIETIFTKGIPKPINIIQTLYPWQKKIENIFFTEPDDRKIYWFWENKGNVGKSAFVKYMIVKHKSLFCDGGKKSDLINLVFNNDMDECKCVIWDLPRATKGNISYSTLESIKNGMVCNTKYETGIKVFNPPHIFVFANFPPENPDQLSEDRWIIEEINNNIKT